MDNMRFDQLQFSPQEFPSMDQLLREQAYASSADADQTQDYARRDPMSQPYAPQGGYGYAPQGGYGYAPQGYGYAPQQAPMSQPYAPQYGYEQADPSRTWSDMPMEHSFMPGHPQAQPHAYGVLPSYEEHVREQQMQQAPQTYYAPVDPNYRPQHMREEPPFEAQPHYAQAPQNGNYEYAADYRQPAMQQPMQPPVQKTMQPPVQKPMQPPVQQPMQPPVQQPMQPPVQQPVQTHQTDYRPGEPNAVDSLPTLTELQQALEEERLAERRAQEAQRREQQAARPYPAPQMQRPVEPVQPQEPAAAQQGQRFVIEDIVQEEADESAKKKTETKEQTTQFSSLLKRFLQKNS